MMAKMFYTLDETKAALGKNEEEIKQLSREGRLREFRDGPRLMFKADQVEQLKAELGGMGDVVSLGPSDTGAPLGIADSRGASGSVIALVDSTGSRSPVTTSSSAAAKEETAFADLGLSGTVGGVPSPGRISPQDSALSGTGAGTRHGVTVFDVDDAHRVDPSAQTAIGSGVQDQVNLESVGSGSGLLDLTRESDDTSLGAVFDDLTPGGSGSKRGTGAPVETAAGSGAGMAALGEARMSRAAAGGAPIYVEAADPSAPAFGGMALAAAIVVIFALFTVAAAVMGYTPGIVTSVHESGLMYLLGAVVGVGIFGGVGFFLGRSGAR